ncbi:MAG: DUF2314 domain-containing protein [Nibricoccus sp.]
MDSPPGETSEKGDLSDLLFAIGGAVLAAYGGWEKSVFLVLLGLVVTVTYYGQWRGYPWSGWASFGLAIFGAGFLGLMWYFKGFGWTCAGGLAACAIGSWLQIKEIVARRKASREADKPMLSFVLWERAPRMLDDRILAQIISSAWPGEYTRQDEDAACFVVGSSPVFMVKSPSGMYMIHNQAQPYLEDTKSAAESTKNLRIRKAIEEHQAWLSVDLLSDPFDPSSTRETIYREIGRLIAELSGPGTIGLFHPESGRFFAWSPELEQAFKSGDGLNALEENLLAPVVPISPDNEDMEAAIAQARARWPEFVAAFSKRHPEHMFSVKAPLTSGEHTEHIWISVEAIEDDIIRGRIGNDPVNLGDYKLNDKISIPVAEIEDWMYLLSDKPVGGFTVDVVTKAMRK